jgi:hypothetical protein
MKMMDLVISPPDSIEPVEIMGVKQVRKAMPLLYRIEARNATKIDGRQ